MSARLIVSLSGLTADTPAERGTGLARAVELAAALDARGVPLSQLFRPRGRDGVVEPGSPLVGWLRERCAHGDVIVLHGYDHSVAPLGSRLASGLIGRRAEFAGLPRHEANLRLAAARRAIGGTGLTTDLFVPPRWLTSTGTLDALHAHPFAVCADDAAVRLLRGPGAGRVIRSRVLGFRAAGQTRGVAEDHEAAEVWRCRLFETEALRMARRDTLIRIALRADDLQRSIRVRAALAAVDGALARGAVPATYRSAAAAFAHAA